MIERLTEREREIALLVRDGLASKQIAHRLGISSRTVDGSIASSFAKLQIDSRVTLAVLADRFERGCPDFDDVLCDRPGDV